MSAATPVGVARDRLARFLLRFGEPYRRLAWYAAVPLILTPELLNYLRVRFLRGRDGVPWIAEADLLLSDLCVPVGYEQYALDQDVRALLLDEMRACAGPEAMAEAARLLLRYVRQLGRDGSGLGRTQLQAEQWSAMAYLQARRGEAAHQIAEAFCAGLSAVVTDTLPGGIPDAELARLVHITAELAPNLEAHRGLLDYAGEVARLLEDPARLDAVGRSVVGGGPSLPTRRIEGVRLPSLRVEGPDPVGVEDRGVKAFAKEPIPFRDAFTDGSGDGPEMIWLSGGAFRMGSPEGIGSDREHPAHAVTLSHHAVGKYPVTVGEFREFVDATGYETEAEKEDGAWVWNKGDPGLKSDASWRKPYMEQDD